MPTDAAAQVIKLINGATATNVGSGTAYTVPKGTPNRAFQAVVSGTGAVTATVAIYGSNDGVNWELIATIILSGTASDSDGYVSAAPWPQLKAEVTAISGTGAAVTATVAR